MTITIELSKEEETELTKLAQAIGKKPTELVHDAVVAFLKRPVDAEFEALAEQVLKEDAELMKRLA